MIVVLKGATEEQIQMVCEKLEEAGYRSAVWKGVERVVVGAIGIIEEEKKEILIQHLQTLPFVEQAVRILKPYKMVSREWKEEPTQVAIREGLLVGGRELFIAAGPCAVEGRQEILDAAWAVKRKGADALRGGAYKPRTSPHAFQGLGREGLEYLKEASEATGLPIVTEVVDPRDVEILDEVADVLQIGTRNMQNFTLLREVGQVRKPVLLKRGMWSTIEEWLQAAEYVLTSGNPNVILCERGIRTFETYTRNTLDLSSVPAVKSLSHLPVLVDPSHGTGRWALVPSMSLAAISAGADGLLIEVHPDPSRALSDGPQSLNPDAFGKLMRQLAPVAQAVGRKLHSQPKE